MVLRRPLRVRKERGSAFTRSINSRASDDPVEGGEPVLAGFAPFRRRCVERGPVSELLGTEVFGNIPNAVFT